MKLTSVLEKISQLGASPQEMQSQISISEVSNIWEFLKTRYDIIETTNVLENFAKDEELKLILQEGTKLLLDQANKLENLMIKFGIPMPVRPPREATSTLKVEIITDRYIFKRLFNGVQGILPVEICAITRASTSSIRDMFRKFIDQELDVLDKLYEYGKVKAYLDESPSYRT